MRPNFKETISQKTDKELEIISKDYAFYSEDERLLAEEELAFRNNPTKELLSKRMGIIEIKMGKDKVFAMTILYLMLIPAGIWMVADPEPTTFFRDPHFIQVLGIVGILYFLILSIIVLKKIFSSGFNLTITKEGIIDNSRFFYVGMIKWEDIESIKSTTVWFNKYLLIYVKDLEKFMSSKQGIKKMQKKYNLMIYGSAIVVSSRFLASDFSNLEKVVMQAYEEYKKTAT